MVIAPPVVETIPQIVVPIIEFIPGPIKLDPAQIPLIGDPKLYPKRREFLEWSDVWEFAKAGYNKIFYGGTRISEFITPADLETAMDAVTSEVIKSLSGFINEAFIYATNVANVVALEQENQRYNQLQENLRLESQIAEAQAKVDAILALAIPSLQAQITQTQHDAQAYAMYAALSERQWNIDHIFTPLYEGIFKVQASATAQVADVKASIPEIVRTVVPSLGLATSAALNTVAAKATAVASWVDDCGEPMCQTVGPKTDLGKALKAFKAAEWLLLLAELAALDKGGIEGLIRSVQGSAHRILDVFAELFVGGSGHLGGTLTKAGS